MLDKYSIASFAVMALLVCSTASAVNWNEQEGSPWNRKTDTGPDAQVNGFYINLGITGARAKLTEKYPQYLVIAYVFKATPADGKLEVDDLIIGANGKPFTVAHKNGYGMDRFGGEGPLMAFGDALGESQTAGGRWNGKLELDVKRGDKKLKVTMNIGTKYGQYADTYPYQCTKTDLILKELYPYIAGRQNANGSFPGGDHVGTIAALALQAGDDPRYMANAKRFAQYIAKSTDADCANEFEGLTVWKYTFAGIYLAEYYLATGERWVLPELEEVRDWLIGSQFMDPKDQLRSDRSETKKEGHVAQFVGGWGHNPYYEGYGPMSITTGQAAMAFALMFRCGVKIDQNRHEMAYDFLARGTNNIGYVWYNSVSAGDNSWADMGRTGSSAVANYLAPYADAKYMRMAMLSAKCIGDHPKSFPDTHGCPPLGMVWTAMAAHLNPQAFKNLINYHKWWFNLAQCPDGTFVSQPNRDAGGSYTSEPRLFMSSVVALIFSVKNQRLRMMGAKVTIEGVNPARLSLNTRKPFELLENDRYAEAHRMLIAARKKLQDQPDAPVRPSKSNVTPDEDLRVIAAMLEYIDSRWQKEVTALAEFEASGDILALSEKVAKLLWAFRGVKSFDDKIKRYEEGLAKDPWRKEVLTGKAYLSHLGVLQKYKSASAVKKLDQFVADNAGSIYGKWAAAVVKEFKADGTISVSAAGKPFGER